MITLSRCLYAAGVAVSLLSAGVDAAPKPVVSLVNRDLKFDFAGTKIRGVNLGGWLLLEPWITPSVFKATPDEVVDEFTMGKVLGKDEATKRLEAHWSSFITEGDFADIASKGLNFVRIPIGYWAITPLDGDPYSQGAYEYLGQALDWAQGAGLKVMIDLHGAPGSQNGLDNSGQRGAVRWGQGDTVAQTLRALAKIRDDHANHPAVAVIELLNEPMGPKLDMNMVRQFMADGVASLGGSNVAIAFHDAFQGPGAWNGWSSGPAEKLILDTHHYEVFNAGQLAMSPDQHVGAACGFGAELASSNKIAINGEWSGAMTDCVSRETPSHPLSLLPHVLVSCTGRPPTDSRVHRLTGSTAAASARVGTARTTSRARALRSWARARVPSDRARRTRSRAPTAPTCSASSTPRWPATKRPTVGSSGPGRPRPPRSGTTEPWPTPASSRSRPVLLIPASVDKDPQCLLLCTTYEHLFFSEGKWGRYSSYHRLSFYDTLVVRF